jgi:hypothetical protein
VLLELSISDLERVRVRPVGSIELNSDVLDPSVELAVIRRLRVVLASRVTDLVRVREASFEAGAVATVLDVAGGVELTVVTSVGRVAALYPAAEDVAKTVSSSSQDSPT